MNTLIPSSETSSWSLKILYWKKNRPNNSKMAMKNFSYERLLWKSLHSIETLTPEKFSWPFLNYLDDFSSNTIFLNSKKTFQSSGSEYALKTNLEASRQTRGAKDISRTVLKSGLKTK
jgi:hypothetical protein